MDIGIWDLEEDCYCLDRNPKSQRLTPSAHSFLPFPAMTIHDIHSDAYP